MIRHAAQSLRIVNTDGYRAAIFAANVRVRNNAWIGNRILLE